MRLATIGGGGGGFEAGAMRAGLRPVWTVECDEPVAAVHAANFDSRIVLARAEDVDYKTLPRVDWLHMSTVCVNASVAKKNGKETREDVAMAEGCARAITSGRARYVSVENVWGYRKFESFRIVLHALEEAGYRHGFWHLNAADFGVPQTRKRLILLASGTHTPHTPKPTHAKGGADGLPPWVGWYAAIEDLIDTLPIAKKDRRLKEPCEWDAEGRLCRDGVCRGHFAKWQDKRLPFEVVGPFLATVGGEDSDYLTEGQPSPVISATHGAAKYRAFIVEGTAAGEDNKFSLPVRASQNPIFTVRGSNPLRAFIVEGSVGGDRPPTVRGADEPMFTYTANNGTGRLNPTRAFLIGGANTSDEQAGEGVGDSDALQPTRCVNASNSAHWRAWLECGRVVSMTPRALARFQTIPDSYVLPESKSLACKVVGNAVPSLLAEILCRHLPEDAARARRPPRRAAWAFG